MNKGHCSTMTAMLICTGLGATPVVAQQPSLTVEPLSSQTDQCWTSGSGGDYMRFCISKHGNLTLFESPKGREHIRLGTIVEGYNLCHYPEAGEPLDYYDFGYAESGWQEPYRFQQPGGPGTLPYSIFRKTTDGMLELVQTVTRNTSEREVTLKIVVFNRSSTTLYGVLLKRSVDFDVNNTAAGDVFLATRRSLIAYDGDSQPGVSVTYSPDDLTNTNVGPVVHAFTFPEWRDAYAGRCSGINAYPIWTPTPPGDYVGVIRYDFKNIPPGASRSVTLIYRAL